MANYTVITDEIKEDICKIADGVFTDSSIAVDETHTVHDVIKEPKRQYRDVQAQFKSFPAALVLDGIAAGKEPEEISDDVYTFMKYGGNKAPETKSIYNGVQMKNFSDYENVEQENMLRYIAGAVLLKLQSLVVVGP